MSSDLRQQMETSLAEFGKTNLASAATGLLNTLGYRSEKTLDLDGSPDAFVEQFDNSPDQPFNKEKALFDDWKSVEFLFQLTDEELGKASLFETNDVNTGLLQSYLFFAVELTGDNYARGKLTSLTRQINRLFPTPVMVLIKHLSDKQPVLSIAVMNRRQNKRDAARDVLGKVTIIRNISLFEPHRGHLDILSSFATENLVHPQRLPIDSFDALHAAWEKIFNVELLNKRFYRELANWYFWALPQIDFPADTEPDDEKRRATSLIRLLTRLIFCWFLKEKGLIPEKLFNAAELKDILSNLNDDTCTYHQGILQNLFFATLNQRMGKDSKGQPYRRYVTEKDFQGKSKEHGITNLYRYPEHFISPDDAPGLFAEIPFLNGGLFECLDREDPDNDNKMLRVDGFTTRGARPVVPNELFFSGEQKVDLSDAYGEKKKKDEQVHGLLNILNSYKFTIVENTPIDQEIALDPELLGKVFENLLASYNEETKTTARKQTGSFYTPRPIVDYMVDECLKAHLTTKLVAAGYKNNDTLAEGLDRLLGYTEKELRRIRHDHFAATTRQKKMTLQKRDRELREELTKELSQLMFGDQETSRKLAAWDPYDPQQSAAFFEPLVLLVQFAKRDNRDTASAQFLENLIDACVMECYFRDHMAERDLLFLDELAPHLENYDPQASEAKQLDFLKNLHNTLNAPSSKIRNRLLRITADSPDLLAVIKEEGKV